MTWSLCEKMSVFLPFPFSLPSSLHSFLLSFVKEICAGAPGWLSQVSIWLLISVPVMIPGSWDWAPCRASYWVWSLLKILSFPLPLLLPHTLSLSQIKRERERERNKERYANLKILYQVKKKEASKEGRKKKREEMMTSLDNCWVWWGDSETHYIKSPSTLVYVWNFS